MSLIRRLGRPGLWNPRIAPREPVEVDWRHPLSRNLVALYIAGFRHDFAGRGPRLELNTGKFEVGSTGLVGRAIYTASPFFPQEWKPTTAHGMTVFGIYDLATQNNSVDAIIGIASPRTNTQGYNSLQYDTYGGIYYTINNGPGIPGFQQVFLNWSDPGSLNTRVGPVSVAGTTTYGGNQTIWVDGRNVKSAAAPSGALIDTSVNPDILLGLSSTYHRVPMMALYSRELPAAEIKWLSAEPYAMLRPITRRIFTTPALTPAGTASGTGAATAVGRSIATAVGTASGTGAAIARTSSDGVAAGTGTATGVGIGARGAVTLFGSSFATTNSSAFTATATPAVGDLLVVIGGFTGNTTTPTVTDNNSSGTYTLVNSALKATSADKLYMWVRNARIASAASTVVTITPSGATTGGGLAVYRIAGGDRVGSAAVRQSAVQANQTSGTPAPAMAAAANRKNVILGGVMNAKNPAGTTAPTGFARDTNLGYATPTAGLTTVSKVSDFGLSTLTWGGTGGVFASIVAEFDVDIASVGAASGTGTATGVAPSAASAGSASGTGAASAVGAAIWTATGTASGTGAAAATGQATASGAGSAAGTSTAIATPIVSGAASGIGTATAVGAALAAATGSASGTGSAAAVGTSLALATGSASGTGTATGVALTAASVGSAAGSGTAAAVGAPLATGTGAAAGVGAASAAGASTAAGAGSAAGTGAATGSGRSTATAAGASAGTGTATAVGTVTTVGAGSAAGTGTASATGAALATAVGSASGAGVATGAAVTGASVGSAAGQGTATGVGAPLATGTGASSGTGAATATGQATATSTGAASGIGSATATPVVRGIATGTGTATGVGASLAVAAGSAAGVGAASAVGASTATATGTASGVGTATGIVQSVGFASGTSTAAAVGKAVSIGAGQAAGTGVAAAAGSSLALAIGIASGSAIVIAVPRLDALPRPQDSAASARIVGNAATGRSGGSGAIPRTVPAGASARLSGNAAGPRN